MLWMYIRLAPVVTVFFFQYFFLLLIKNLLTGQNFTNWPNSVFMTSRGGYIVR